MNFPKHLYACYGHSSNVTQNDLETTKLTILPQTKCLTENQLQALATPKLLLCFPQEETHRMYLVISKSRNTAKYNHYSMVKGFSFLLSIRISLKLEAIQQYDPPPRPMKSDKLYHQFLSQTLKVKETVYFSIIPFQVY